jgi:hypothetical protein
LSIHDFDSHSTLYLFSQVLSHNPYFFSFLPKWDAPDSS